MELIVITSIDSRASKHVQGGCQLMSFRRHREEEEGRRRDEIVRLRTKRRDTEETILAISSSLRAFFDRVLGALNM
ncbi:hypothetical protein PanWU01x14_257390 [Parasponia andersonii]|uniref:Uncharacterized protein n=1 Tax=Parasponia andersonii TaxID=3476 RepID=A0A2P5BA15_PARAD|nr:hypothetical protein PanWU01x14_257390 [Parasponia andersonii]